MSGAVSTLYVPHQKSRRLAIERLLLIALAAIFSASTLHAGQAKHKKHDLRNEIFSLEDQWRDAVLKSDTNAMSALLADDYMAITPSGILQTKQEALDSMRAHRVHITTMLLSDRKVRFYGKTALVTSLAEVRGTTIEGDVAGSFRYTRVYVRDAQGKWKIVSFESSRLHQPGEHRKHDSEPIASNSH
jgi:ketosteroid isomerase-like protein